MFGAPITQLLTNTKNIGCKSQVYWSHHFFSMSREISYFSMVNPRKSTFFYGESQEIHIFLWWIPGNPHFSMVNPRKSTFFYGESQEISHFPMKSPCAEPPPHHASVGGIVRGLLGIRILFGRGDLHGAHLGDRRRDFGERRNGENTIDIYIYTYIYI